MTVLYYPRGFRQQARENAEEMTGCQPTGSRREDAYLVVQGDPYVNQMHAQYCTNRGFFWKLDRVEELLALARYMLPSLNEFIALQTSNPALYRHQVEFLQETIYKVATGTNRTMAPMTYLQLMDDYPVARGTVMHRGIRPIQINRRFPSGPRAIEHWLSHPSGCNDLLETLYVLFGAPRTS